MALTRKQKRERMLQKRNAQMGGEGMYIFQNITSADLMLPRPTKSGRKWVGPREKFVGDSYYKSLKEVICLQEVQPAMSEQKLITEVPPQFNHDGKVEYVQKQPDLKPLTEDEKKKQQEPEEILLTETPLDGIRIMR